MKNFILLFCTVVVLFVTETTAQIKKKPTAQKPTSLPQNVSVPPYLKLVTPRSELHKRNIAAAKPVQSRSNFNAGAADILISGMDPGSFVNYADVLKRGTTPYKPADTIPIALTFPVGSNVRHIFDPYVKYQAVMPIRQNNGNYFYDLSAEATPNAKWSLRYRPNADLSLITTFNFVESGDKNFFLFSSQGDLLSLISVSGQSAPKVTMRKPSEPIKTRWYIYQHMCPNVWLWIYNAQYKVFLGRIVVGKRATLVAVPAADVLNNRVPANVSTHWDIRLENYVNSYLQTYGNYIPDRDGDGADDVVCGGDDCNDYDASVHPGATEICDANGKDEDCNAETIGSEDNDGDGYTSMRCFNGTNTGHDCDDNNAAIKPGTMKYISETQVDVCPNGLYDVDPSMRAVRQPNGTAIVIPRQ